MRPSAAWWYLTLLLAGSLLGCGEGTAEYPGFRPLEGRISGFEHAPFERTLLEVEPEVAARWLAELDARRLEIDALAGVPALAARARLAAAQLDFEMSARLFEAAYQLTLDPTHLVEASAVHRELARRPGGDFHLAEALELALRAEAAGDRSAEGLFNRAIALEQLGFDDAAKTTWERYLHVDATGPWAEEAARRLAAIRQRRTAAREWETARTRLEHFLPPSEVPLDRVVVEDVAKRLPEFARQLAEGELLAAWAHESDPHRAERIADLMAAMGDALAERNDDLLLRDLVAGLQADGVRGRLQGAVQHYLAGLEAVNVQGGNSRHELQVAQEMLTELGSPLAGWAELQRLIALWYAGEYSAVLSSVDRLSAWAEERRYRSLQARCLQIAGIAHHQLRDYSQALAGYLESEHHFERLGEEEQVVHLESTAALTQLFLGRSELAWERLVRSVRQRDRIVQPRRRYSLNRNGGEIALEAGYPRTAGLFFSQAHRAAQEWGSAAAIAEATWWRARSHYRLGNEKEALSLLRSAEKRAAEIEETSLRQRILGDLPMVEGETLIGTDPARALELLDQALERYRGSDYRDYQPRVLRLRARALGVLGRPQEALADLVRAIEIFEADRGLVGDSGARVALFDLATGLFEDAIQLHLAIGEPEQAFALVERAKSRSLLDALASSRGTRSVIVRPLAGPAISAVLGDGVVLVEFTVLDDRVIAWLVDAHEVRFHSLEIGAAELARLVDRARATLEASPWDPSVLRELYSRLWGPLTGDLSPGTDLVIVADQSLHRLPFALLQDADGHYLIESHALTLAPSGSVYAQAMHRLSSRRIENPGFLVAFGAPDLSGSELSWLPGLPAAIEETNMVAQLYPVFQLRVGPAASKAEFLALAASADVLHVVTHAVARPDVVGLSKLLLAAGEEGDGDLSLDELWRVRLDGPRLVVLSACETARGRVWRNEGSVALSHAFLAAGVPTVVASLWQVEDGVTGDLLVPFHRYLRAGRTPAKALRQAQLELLARDGRSSNPKHWAAFQVYGGGQVPLFAGVSDD